MVGNYLRFDETIRNRLKDVEQDIIGSLRNTTPGQDNYLIWGPSGSGKTFFVRQLKDFAVDLADYKELNLADRDERKFRSVLAGIDTIDKPRLIFIDEVDSEEPASWAYDALLPSLKPPPSAPRTRRTCFILAGSHGEDIEGLKEKIRGNDDKGKDLLTRVTNDVEIPEMKVEDRILAALIQFSLVGKEHGLEIREVEKLALFYIATNKQLKDGHHLEATVTKCVERMPDGEDRVKFDHLFVMGDSLSGSLKHKFWEDARPEENQLTNMITLLQEIQPRKAAEKHVQRSLLNPLLLVRLGNAANRAEYTGVIETAEADSLKEALGQLDPTDLDLISLLDRQTTSSWKVSTRNPVGHPANYSDLIGFLSDSSYKRRKYEKSIEKLIRLGFVRPDDGPARTRPKSFRPLTTHLGRKLVLLVKLAGILH